MSGKSASEALAAAVMARLRTASGLSGVHDGPPVRAAHPFAIVEIGPESDWGHKSGAGRELWLAVTLRDRGERPERLRRLMREVEAAVAGLGSQIEGWQLVTCALIRSRSIAAGTGEWTASLDWRAKMLAAP